jgi:hypothetical protein
MRPGLGSLSLAVAALLTANILLFLPTISSANEGRSNSPNWSCQIWDQCLNASWSPTKPGPGDAINFTVTVITADDVLDTALLYYKYKIPYQDWQPSIDWFSLRMTNDSNSKNKVSFHGMHDWIGGVRLQFWFEAYDPQHNRLRSPYYGLEVSGNDSWTCDVPNGWADCISTDHGYLIDGIPVHVDTGGQLPQFSKIYVDIQSIRGMDPLRNTSIKSAIMRYWYEDKDGNRINGPYNDIMDPQDANRTMMSTDQPFTSDPEQYFVFNVSASDMYDRVLISPDYRFFVNGTASPPLVPIWINVVVTYVDKERGKVTPLQGIEVTFTNSTCSVTNITDSQGKASYFTYQYGKDTWTMSATYNREPLSVRDILPNRTRVKTNNFTYYLTFKTDPNRPPTQEDVDPNYFLYIGIGLVGFITVAAPMNARYFMEKRRREELKRIEKEARFKI